MTTRPLTIDCQVHCYERNRPERPWHGHPEGPEEVTGDDMVEAMAAVGRPMGPTRPPLYPPEPDVVRDLHAAVERLLAG